MGYNYNVSCESSNLLQALALWSWASHILFSNLLLYFLPVELSYNSHSFSAERQGSHRYRKARLSANRQHRPACRTSLQTCFLPRREASMTEFCLCLRLPSILAPAKTRPLNDQVLLHETTSSLQSLPHKAVRARIETLQVPMIYPLLSRMQ